jgi:hypothetical protein
MPIVYVHGVAIRDQSAVPTITTFLQHYVAPAISREPNAADRVRVLTAQWGADAVRFSWNHASVPVVKSAGVEERDRMPELAIGLLKKHGQSQPSAVAREVPPKVWSLSADQLSSVISAALQQIGLTEGDYAHQATALDSAVRQVVPKRGASVIDAALLDRVAAEANRLLPSIERAGNDRRAAGTDAQSFSPITDLTKRALRSASDQLGALSTEIFLRKRPVIDAIITNFIGDVFAYLTRRGEAEAPGPIITDFLDVLVEAKRTQPREPLVVLSHSMGGQIVYDCASYYIPRSSRYSKIRIDFWIAAGSQVGLFEEMKLFKASDTSIRAPQKVAAPTPHVGYWCNVWDPHDILSYTAAPIFAGVDDECFESNLPVHLAHFGYLSSPAFYHRIGQKIRKTMK